ncbi:siphovirus ReqiPepy6 Gp37-like family protein [Clostridium sp. MSJ-8]|uniref:siphovirus ReqiPepy6 Gp37-like family protein n=1 Tax=Clostridium sp. MSJ-8 TaxID=2841510 RepID=UPI001C0F168D|nr:siphovirus ReqiPepy6 Gp37-like family protein [Clostridium sp. MSJ-8]MBU5487029.1 siphovirus ReqiPepy6 Gp37-like family protein [Clostridium sp. MSJ-8]
MELYILDKNLDLLGVIDNFETLIWTRKYTEPGKFQLNLPATEDNISLMKDENIVYKKDDVEGGIIKHIEYSVSDKGEKSLVVNGNLTTSYLSRRINWGTIKHSGRVDLLMQKIVKDNCISPNNSNRIIPTLEIISTNYTDAISKQDSYSNLTDLLTDICNTKNFGYRVRINTREGARYLAFEVYKGIDRSVNQSAISPTIFSLDMENILTEDYIKDNSNFKNTTLIAGAGEGNARKTTIVGNNYKELDRFEIYTDARDIQDTEQQEVMDDEGNTTTEDVEIPWSEYEPLLLQRGNEKLAEYEKIETFEGTINTDANNVYKVDYDLGDIVTIVDKDLGIKLDTRITEIEETYEKGKVEIVPTFGNNIPNLLTKLKQLERR